MTTKLPDPPTTSEVERAIAKYGFDAEDAEAWRKKYMKLRGRAPQTGQRVLLTFSQYLRLAQKAGMTAPTEIGCRLGKFQLARKGDVGDYVLGNCRFITMEANIAEKKKNGGTARQAEKLRSWMDKNPEWKAKKIAASAKSFRVVSPKGKKYNTSNLREFCRTHKLNRQYMRGVFLGRRSDYKGWTGSFVEPKSPKHIRKGLGMKKVET